MDMDGHNNSHQYIPDPTNLCRVSDPGLDLSDRKKMDLDSAPQKKSYPNLIIFFCLFIHRKKLVEILKIFLLNLFLFKYSLITEILIFEYFSGMFIKD